MHDPLIKINKLGDLFEKYRARIKPPQSSVEKVAHKVISERTPLQIPLEKIVYTVSTKTLSINVPSVVKSELNFYKADVLKSLKSELGEQNSPKYLR